MTQTRTIFDVLNGANNDGYANVRIVGGADRVKKFNKLAPTIMVSYMTLTT